MSDKVAAVVGSNRGLGFGIVKELCKRGVEIVYLTARDENKGKEAVKLLEKEGLRPLFHQLDVTDKNSIKSFAEHLKNEHGGLDILFNNAAIITADLKKTSYEDANNVINVNYKGILLVQEYIFPVLKDNASVINISSNSGHISNITNTYWISKITSNSTKLKDINDFIDWFLESVKQNTLDEEDFVEMPMLAYRISKIAVSALTRVQQREIGRNISINSYHPGFIKTGMSKWTGLLTADEAAVVPVYLVLDVDQSVKGKYIWFDKTEKDWSDPKLKIHCTFKTFEDKLVENYLI